MKQTSFATTLVLLAMSGAPAFSADEPPQPHNNLGQQVAGSVEVVYPAPGDVIEETIQYLEDTKLTPEQWRRIKELSLEREREKSTPFSTPPKPVTRTLPLNLDPGVSPPVIRLSLGQLSSIVFSDNNGNPWTIKHVVFNKQLFSDGREGQQGEDAEGSETNVLSLEPTKVTSYGNVTVTLKGLPTPVILILTSGQNEVDMRVDAKVPGRNPDAGEDYRLASMPRIDTSLSSFLDGVPPKEAKRLKITGLDGAQAWSFAGNLFLRANGDVQYPAYITGAKSTSGTSIYQFAGLQNAVTLTAGGQAVTVFIETGETFQ